MSVRESNPSDAPRVRRSVLYLPAGNARALDKARTLPADALILDLEDAVAPAAKDDARRRLADAFAAGGFGARETVIRVNDLAGPWLDADLACVAGCRPDALLLPKVTDAAGLDDFVRAGERAGLRLARGAAAAGEPAGPDVWLMIETLAALADLPALLSAAHERFARLRCLVVGTNDLAKESGVSPDDDRRYLTPWLMSIVLAARLRGLAVLDGVWNDFRDADGFEREALQSLKMGFDGKTLIHPTQIEPANRIFTPSDTAIAQARAVVAAFALPEHAKAGVINLDGRMVERLHLAQAERLLAIADQIAQRG